MIIPRRFAMIAFVFVLVFVYSLNTIVSQHENIVPARWDDNNYSGDQQDMDNILAVLLRNESASSTMPVYTTSSSLALPEPLQVLKQYKEWHSVDSLRQNPHNRTYAIGYYSCPLQAGNRLHHFFNSLLWAVVTNRTLLWKYYDQETCERVQLGQMSLDPNICKVANTVDGCDPILERASWIPSHDEFADNKLQQLEKPLYLNFWSTHAVSDTPWFKQPRNNPWHDSYVNFTGIDKRSDWPLVSFPVMLGMSRTLERARGRKQLLATDWARDIADRLYSMGAPFLFGMIFRESFAMTSVALDGIPLHPTSESDFTLALHSRHSKPQQDGSNVKNEQRCLTRLLEQQQALSTSKVNTTTYSCRVFLMSDRPLTLEKLGPWLAERNCSVVTAPHQNGTSFKNEHGPWSRLGFYQDLATASQARHGLIAKDTTSSKLLLEMIEYDRTMEAWGRGVTVTEEPLLYCDLKEKKQRRHKRRL